MIIYIGPFANDISNNTISHGITAILLPCVIDQSKEYAISLLQHYTPSLRMTSEASQAMGKARPSSSSGTSGYPLWFRYSA